MKKLARAFLSFVAALAVAIPVLSFTLASTAGASTVTYTATQSFTPPSSNFAGVSAGGDGWDVATYNGRVYNVFHHQTAFYLMCHNQSDASACWSTTDTGTANTYKTITVNGAAFGTSGKPGLYIDQSTGYLYVFAVQTSNVQPGVVCINLNAADTVTDPACTGTGGQPAGFTPLAAAGSSGWTAGTGTGSTTFAYYGGKLYDWNPAAGHTASTGGGGASGNGDNAELCYDIATQSACTGEPYAVSVSASSAATNTDATSGPAYSTTLVGSDLFIPTSWSTGGVVACLQLDLATPGNCAGTWPQTLGLTTSSMVIPSLDSSGNSTGVCGFTGSLWQCWNFDGTSQPTPAGLTSSVLQSWQWAGSPAVVGTRIFQIVPANPNGLVYCYDFATDGACTTSTGHFPISLANSSNIYSVTADSQRPTCLWTNADTGSEQIQNFDALTGGSCASAPVRVFASSFVEPYQACVPTQFTSITLTSGNLATGSTPTLSFTNGNGVVIDGPYPFTMTGSQPTLNLTTLAYPTPIDLSTKSALPQFVLNLTPGTGGLGTIGVEASWSGSQLAQCTPGYTGPAPSTASASSVADTSAQLNGSVNNTSTDTVSPVQFCYQTTTFTSGQCTGTVVSATPGTVSASVTPYSTSLTGLTHSTTYYYELVATDATTASALYGGVQSFTTGPTLTTGPATSVANTSATLTGSLYNPAGDTLVSGPSFCYQTTSFTVGTCTGTTTQAVAGTSSPSGTEYSLGLTGLTAGQTYYFEALATDQTTGGAIYGQVQSFTAAPIVTASPVTHIADTSATANGNLYNPNGDSAQVQFCYSTTSFSSGPCSGTLAGSIAGATVGSTSAWSSNLTSLSPGTTYYVEMVVTDSTLSTTFYSPVETFTTGPVITTTAALNTRSNSTTLSANLYNPGTDSGTTVTFCYSTTSFLSGGCGSTPVAASAGTTSGSTTVYTANLTSLTPGATYYYEAVLNDPAATPTVRYGGVQTVVTGPIVTTAAATGSTSSATTLNGTINNPNSVSLGSITFCYQLTTFTSGGCTGSSVSAVAGSTIGTTTSYSAQINSLNPYTSYYYELVSTPSVGAPYYGGVDTFQTAGITPAISTATITGTPTVGQTLTAHSSGVSGAPTPTESYQWLDNGTAITGATSVTYVVTPSDFGHALTVTITETNSVGVASATSLPTTLVAGLAPTITTATITGTPTVGQTLTAHSTGVTGTPTPTESYQWLDNGTAIPGANSSTYVVPSADYHQPITVTITETNSVGAASATSSPTTSVASNQPPVISTVVVSPTGTGVITWSPTPNVPSSDYVVQYTTNGGKTWVTVPSSDISGTTATVPGLNTSSNFQFRVSTTTSAGSTTSVSKATTPTKVFPTSPISLPSKPFAAYRATFGASANDIKVIITTLREVSALHLKSVTIIGYAIYETKAHDGKGKYLTMNQVRNLAKSRAYSAIKFMQGLERKLHIAPVKFVVKPVIEMGKSHLKNFEKFRRVALQI